MNRKETRGRRTSYAQRIVGILAVSAQAFGLAACGKTEAPAPTGQGQGTSLEQPERPDTAGTQKEKPGASAQDDAKITAQVVDRLDKDPELAGSKIEVDTVDGKVTLDGPAPSTIARDRAETIARAVSGVTEVSNQLLVTGHSNSSS